ncbi:septal ring lytic transglycosylase RlpA family protein [Solimonas soli]|uniref:septal ring lytic transglycosylase RlpA family protein n=1 Tax=Solimonas soli TaxID=413479 RepID=UPI0004AFADD6|nr:septal ring lytic transglycosylase RlpA family protein [Solimonas soli]
MRALRRLALALALLPLAACLGPVGPPPVPGRTPSTGPRPPPHSNGTRPRVVIAEPGIKDSAPNGGDIPPDVANTPDAVPKREPRSRSGNPPEYEAFGEIYRVIDDPAGFSERGRASWYGKKFQGKKTASGEPYDMFAMTAAHKTLPIPSYVRVTNLENHRTAVVRINDRGPFHSERIIDLSYAAAARLGIIDDGHAEVEIRALQPDGDGGAVAVAANNAPAAEAAPPPTSLPGIAAPKPPPVPKTAGGGAGRWLQIAAYSDPINAIAMRDELSNQGLKSVAVRASNDGKLHRVVIGPYARDSDAQDVRDWLHDAGYAAFWIKG